MLHDDRAGDIGRQFGEHRFDGPGASGGGADGENLIRRQLEARLFGGMHLGLIALVHFGHLGRGGDANLLDQNLGDLGYGIGCARFADHVHSSQPHRLQGGLAALGGQRTDHDNRHGEKPHQLRKERKPIHTRHFQVQRDHIRVQLDDFIPGDIWVYSSSNDLNIVRLGEFFGENFPYDGGIIDD